MKEVDTSPLETELAYFEENRAELLARYLGKFVLVKGTKLVGTFDSAEAAYDAGVSAFGLESFLIREVELVETVASIPGLYAGVLPAER